MPHLTLPDSTTSLYYEFHGEGEQTLVLLNGITMTTAAWAWHVPHYTPHFRVLCLDFRGQGQSSKPDEPAYPLTEQADDLAAALTLLGVARAHVLGLSYGGMVAQHFAHRHPTRVARLVLASTLAYSDAANAAMAASWAAAQAAGGADLRFTESLPWVFGSPFLAAQQPLLAALRGIAAQHPWSAVERLTAGVLSHDARPWLAQLTQPTLVLVGNEDRLTPRYQADCLVDMLPDAQLVVLPHVGHASHLEALPAFVAETAAFFRG